ncbi:uncharacterized protein CcaverHIS019_0401490 [Cutaneotrichosporon cavernicola]|uniref:Uncharacterized protein n=1 Tax=Cutaneotrichosporon cavernicola TaxID=279322 RepID=A0AA48L3K7_9TREE|nr:uncharacterized protein CcaverHIS019_0401490 [Cutaneotrichosporon cavernicola]BEI91329.1 hypothetical protein CcaverHIS019_0401490 [Cutaneotrichosporon cavernicola]
MQSGVFFSFVDFYLQHEIGGTLWEPPLSSSNAGGRILLSRPNPNLIIRRLGPLWEQSDQVQRNIMNGFVCMVDPDNRVHLTRLWEKIFRYVTGEIAVVIATQMVDLTAPIGAYFEIKKDVDGWWLLLSRDRQNGIELILHGVFDQYREEVKMRLVELEEA